MKRSNTTSLGQGDNSRSRTQKTLLRAPRWRDVALDSSGSDTDEHNKATNVFMGCVPCPFCPKHFEDKCTLATHLVLVVGAPYKSKWPHLTDISAIYPGPDCVSYSDTEVEKLSSPTSENGRGDGGGTQGTASNSGRPNCP